MTWKNDVVMELTGSKKTTKRFRKNGFNRRELKRCDEIRNAKGSYSNNKVAGIEYFTVPRRIIDATKTVKIVRMLWKRKLFFLSNDIKTQRGVWSRMAILMCLYVDILQSKDFVFISAWFNRETKITRVQFWLDENWCVIATKRRAKNGRDDSIIFCIFLFGSRFIYVWLEKSKFEN